jgi:hypothetical protein
MPKRKDTIKPQPVEVSSIYRPGDNIIIGFAQNLCLVVERTEVVDGQLVIKAHADPSFTFTVPPGAIVCRGRELFGEEEKRRAG